MIGKAVGCVMVVPSVGTSSGKRLSGKKRREPRINTDRTRMKTEETVPECPSCLLFLIRVSSVLIRGSLLCSDSL
jgi:hypothetical protein